MNLCLWTFSDSELQGSSCQSALWASRWVWVQEGCLGKRRLAAEGITPPHPEPDEQQGCGSALITGRHSPSFLSFFSWLGAPPQVSLKALISPRKRRESYARKEQSKTHLQT